MKALLTLVTTSMCLLFATTGSSADAERAEKLATEPTWTYLGATISELQCSRVAGRHGFRYYDFGGYLWDGTRWSYASNACFGGTIQAPVPTPIGEALYDIYVREGFDMALCADSIEWELNGVVTRVNAERGVVEAKSSVGVLNDLLQIECVKAAYRTNGQ